MNFIKKLYLNHKNEISLTKVGGYMTCLAGATIFAIPSPVWLIILAKFVIGMGIGTVTAGVRHMIGQDKDNA